MTPAGYKAAVPDSVTLLAKPTKQRHVSVQELTSARRHRTPGIFFLSTRHGLLTDIEAELRGMGGILLAHIGLPLSHVYAVRGALRSKHMAELAAENRAQGRAEGAVAAARTAATEGDRRAVARAGRRIAQAAVELEEHRAGGCGAVHGLGVSVLSLCPGPKQACCRCCWLSQCAAGNCRGRYSSKAQCR